MARKDIGVVVIGRNEGDRLKKCLASLKNVENRVYVDSGSTDGSCDAARAEGFAVVDLDMSKPFSAARARNTGIEWLLSEKPGLAMIQTVDGDCEVRADWIATAADDLEADARRAIVFGRRREREPNRNAYHLACDDEWNVPTGEVGSCGGDALLRVTAIQQVKGYNPALIAGEEPDMCLRLREKGWRIWSNGAEMTWHDVDIDRMGQWWKRSQRAGFAFTELLDRHGQKADPAWRRLVNSALLWTSINAAILPGLGISILATAPILKLLGLVPLALSFLQIGRMARSKRSRYGWRGGFQWAWLMMVAKAAQVQGWMQYKSQAVTRKKSALIEYKR